MNPEHLEHEEAVVGNEFLNVDQDRNFVGFLFQDETTLGHHRMPCSMDLFPYGNLNEHNASPTLKLGFAFHGAEHELTFVISAGVNDDGHPSFIFQLLDCTLCKEDLCNCTHWNMFGTPICNERLRRGE